MGCTKTVIQTEYVYPTVPALPPPLEYFDVKWEISGGKYCTDNTGAKYLLINRQLEQARSLDLETIINGLRRSK